MKLLIIRLQMPVISDWEFDMNLLLSSFQSLKVNLKRKIKLHVGVF